MTEPLPLFPSTPLLLVDDEPPWLRSLSVTLKRSGINHLVQCADSRQVLSLLKAQTYSLIILDLNMPYIGGEELLAKIVQDYPEIPVIILSGMNQLEAAVGCIKSGACDYIVKTSEKERLIASVQRALAFREKEQEVRNLSSLLFGQKLQQPEVFRQMITVSPKMQRVFKYLEAVACSSEPILITGESGTGKELIAQAIQALGCPGQPFVAVNAAGLDDAVFADTLFGHQKGAFTDASNSRSGMIKQAGGGVLFLDEIGDLSLASQVKLLRLLQEHEYHPLGSDTAEKNHARLVFATNQDLAARQTQGQFRKDLYYRLNAHHVQIPPLRERLEDVPVLLSHFVAQAAKQLNKGRLSIPSQLLLLLRSYDFPGNVRELRSMVFNAVSLCHSSQLGLSSFEESIKLERKQRAPQPLEPRQEIEDQPAILFSGELPSLQDGTRLLVNEALRRADGNVRIAAGMLGISRQALAKRLANNSD